METKLERLEFVWGATIFSILPLVVHGIREEVGFILWTNNSMILLIFLGSLMIHILEVMPINLIPGSTKQAE
jgi:hypothetical protein